MKNITILRVVPKNPMLTQLAFCFSSAGGEDDFEIFLANVKARSLAARAQIHASYGMSHKFSIKFVICSLLEEEE